MKNKYLRSYWLKLLHETDPLVQTVTSKMELFFSIKNNYFTFVKINRFWNNTKIFAHAIVSVINENKILKKNTSQEKSCFLKHKLFLKTAEPRKKWSCTFYSLSVWSIFDASVLGHLCVRKDFRAVKVRQIIFFVWCIKFWTFSDTNRTQSNLRNNLHVVPEESWVTVIFLNFITMKLLKNRFHTDKRHQNIWELLPICGIEGDVALRSAARRFFWFLWCEKSSLICSKTLISAFFTSSKSFSV